MVWAAAAKVLAAAAVAVVTVVAAAAGQCPVRAVVDARCAPPPPRPVRSPPPPQVRLLATWHPYDEHKPFGDAGTACADDPPPSRVLARRLWTAANPDVVGSSPDWAEFVRKGCGTCLRLVGPGGKVETVVIVDQKGAEGLDLSPAAYDALGLDRDAGHDFVRASVVDC